MSWELSGQEAPCFVLKARRRLRPVAALGQKGTFYHRARIVKQSAFTREMYLGKIKLIGA